MAFTVNLKNLKDWANKLGGVLVLDNGEPAFIVLSYDKFKALDTGTSFDIDIMAAGNGNGQANDLDDDPNEIERLNQEILALKEEIRQREAAELASSEEEPIIPETLTF